MLEKQATNIKESYGSKISELDKDIKAQLKQIEEQAKDGNKATQDQVDALKKSTEQYNDKLQEMQKHYDALDIRLGNAFGNSNPNKKKSFQEVLQEGLSENKKHLTEKAVNGKHFDFGFDLHSKAVGDMASSSNLSGDSGTYFVTPDRVPGVVGIPSEPNRIRQYLPAGSTTSNVIRHIRYTGKEGAPGMVAEGGSKPQMDFDFTINDESVRKIATYVRVPEEMIEDIPFLSSFIASQGMVELKLVEDAQLISGDGTGQNLNGLITTADDFTAGALAGAIDDAQYISVLRAAANQVRLNYYNPTSIMMHPTDVTLMKELKRTDKGYLIPESLNNAVPSIDGITVIQNTNVPQGEFLIGNFGVAVQLFDRMQSNVRMYDQDRDNPIKNLITVVIEERLALVTYRPGAMVYGAFDTATAALETT